MSWVQGFPSSQSRDPAPAQEPPAQTSPVVQVLPSSQTTVLFTCPQPVAGSQLSSVQGLPSSQFTVEMGVQAPAAHWSPTVQAFPSSQG